MYEYDCTFCQIVSGDRQAEIVYQDEQVIAFKDIHPKAPWHILVTPREHVESLNDAAPRDEALLGHLLRTASKVANLVGIADEGYRVVINTGPNAGQSIFHLHVHVLGGRVLGWPPG
jgi:histidine triad (HIT) family protein